VVQVLRERPRVRESTGAEKEGEAKRFLEVRRGAAAKGEPLMPRADRVRYEEAAADLRQHYEATGARDLAEYIGAWRT
jgi:hypothetical protein